MAAPPQGWVASSLAAGAFFIRLNADGSFGVESPAGTQITAWDTAGDLMWPSNAAPKQKWFQSSGGQSGARFSGLNDILMDPGAREGVPAVVGLDNRSGLTSADGAPITLYTLLGGTSHLVRITADIFATAVSAGTANYTITWTENAQTKTLVVSASVVNTLGTASDLINPDASTAITAQLTFAAFTGTVKVAAIVEHFAGSP